MGLSFSGGLFIGNKKHELRDFTPEPEFWVPIIFRQLNIHILLHPLQANCHAFCNAGVKLRREISFFKNKHIYFCRLSKQNSLCATL